jgi:hypothetical protein
MVILYKKFLQEKAVEATKQKYIAGTGTGNL